MDIPQIKRVALVGAGNQGPKIGFRCMVSGLQASLYDIRGEALDKALAAMETWLAEYQAQKGLSPEETEQIRSRLKRSESLEDCLKDADLIIEAVPEKVGIKLQALKEIDRAAGPDALIATNSSSLPSSLLKDALKNPGRLFNINFSNPQHEHDLLVELMRGEHTEDRTLLAGEKFVLSLGMVPIVTLKEIMGFSFNRTWRAVKKEVLHLADQGYIQPHDMDRAWMMDFGTSFGPFGLMDIVGLDTIRDIENQYYRASGDEADKPPAMLDEKIEAGDLGVKSGRGFYSYPDPEYKNEAWLRKQGPWKSDLAARLNREEK